MSLPVINLDDRQYEDLVAEVRDRLRQALPELAGLAPGDPLYYLTDVFAHLTDQLIYRANLIPERQRRVFLNLMAVPQRSARPSRGIVGLDLEGRAVILPKLVQKETMLSAGRLPFTTEQEVLALPLQMRVLVKRESAADTEDLMQLFPDLDPSQVKTFAPVELVPGRDPLNPRGTVDDALYLALYVPKALSRPESLERVRKAVAGKLLNVGLIPQRDETADLFTRPAPRELDWRIAWCREGSGPRPDCRYLPLPVVQDGSEGGRKAGVARLQLPEAEELLSPVFPDDPADAGYGSSPPALPEDIPPESLICWLRLRSPQDELNLSYLTINAVMVLGQGVERDLIVGIGNGESNQRVRLGRDDVDPDSLHLQVERGRRFEDWYAVPHFAASGPEDPVYRFDPRRRLILFGDGVRGRRPPASARIRIASLRYGGGASGNLPAGSVNSTGSPIEGVKVRHEYPTWGGEDAESVSDAEQRIAATLHHRNRAVTEEDFVRLALDNPVNPVGRAWLMPGFHPGREFVDVRNNVPGVVSLLVLPPATDDGRYPKPNAGLLSDLHQYLSERMLIGTELFVESPRFVPLGLTATFDLVDPGQRLQVEREVQQALESYLWPLAPGGLAGDGWQMGRTVEASELYTAIARVAGVRAIYSIRLYAPDSGRWRPAEDNRVEVPVYGLPELIAVAVSAGGPGESVDLTLEALLPSEEIGDQVAVPVASMPC